MQEIYFVRNSVKMNLLLRTKHSTHRSISSQDKRLVQRPVYTNYQVSAATRIPTTQRGHKISSTWVSSNSTDRVRYHVYSVWDTRDSHRWTDYGCVRKGWDKGAGNDRYSYEKENGEWNKVDEESVLHWRLGRQNKVKLADNNGCW